MRLMLLIAVMMLLTAPMRKRRGGPLRRLCVDATAQ
jgi:hypothetical protein